MVVLQPGIHDISDLEYHADPAPSPSLSRSVAKLMLKSSPEHVFVKTPRLGKLIDGGADDPEEPMLVGTAVHSMFLRGEDVISLIPFATYHSNDAKAAKREAQSAGKIPLKRPAHDAAMRMLERLEKFRQQTGAFTHGKPERTLIWQDDRHYGRCKADWMPDDPAEYLWDFKTTAGFATDEAWQRVAFDTAADMQCAHYCRGSEHLHGEPPRGMRFLVIEQAAPHGIAVFELSPRSIEIGEAKMALARTKWIECTQLQAWPTYPIGVQVIEPPSWESKRWEVHTQSYRALTSTAPSHARRDIAVAKMLEQGHLGG